MKNTYDTVVKIIAETLVISENDITPETRFLEDLKVTSLDIVTLALALEDEFGGQLPVDEIAGLSTIGALVDYIETRLSAV